jgi:hypothetical protein
VIDIYKLTGNANTNKRNTKVKTPPKQQKHYTEKYNKINKNVQTKNAWYKPFPARRSAIIPCKQVYTHPKVKCR